MNIIVCVKQVPDTTEIKIDPVKKTLIRDGVPSILNTFDTFAIEAALRLKDEDPSSRVIVICMGLPQAQAVLKKAISMGADGTYLLSDRAFGGSDTLATSYVLSNGIKEIERRENIKIDVVMCGKQAIDGDTAQVGPEIAEHMNLPQVTCAWEIVDHGEGYITVKKEVDDGFEIIKMKTPCLVTFTKPDFDVRMATVERVYYSNECELPVLTSADIPMDLTRAGLGGSPTKVKSTFTPDVKGNGLIIDEGSDSANAAKLIEKLASVNII